MKRLSVFLVLILTLLSVAALTSCGCEASNQTNQGGQSSTPNENAGDNGSANNGSGSGSTDSGSHSGSGSSSANDGVGSGSNDTLMDDMIIGGEDIVDGVDDTIDDITGDGNGSSSVTPGLSTYEDMIRNGRVRDNDGFLQNDGR